MSVLFGSEDSPRPHEAIAGVSNDLSTRTLTLRLSDQANGYTKLLWREAFQALRRSEEGGWRNGHSTVWASTPQVYQAAYATAGDATFGGLLQFKFQPGEQAYVDLISKPGLTASVWIDRSSNRFINVNLKHKS